MNLPKWRHVGFNLGNPSICGYLADDPEAETLAMGCVYYDFNLPDYDLWLDSLEECDAKEELIERRAKIAKAHGSNDHEAVKRHIEWLRLRRDGILRETFLLPLAQGGQRKADELRSGGQERGKQLSSDKQRKIALCQSIADALWSEVPRSRHATSSLGVKKQLAPKIREQYRRAGHGEPPTAKWIRENIIHPKKNPRS